MNILTIIKLNLIKIAQHVKHHVSFDFRELLDRDFVLSNFEKHKAKHVKVRTIRSFIPRRCTLTGKSLWFQRALVIVIADVDKFGYLFGDWFYVDPDEYALWYLQGDRCSE